MFDNDIYRKGTLSSFEERINNVRTLEPNAYSSLVEQINNQQVHLRFSISVSYASAQNGTLGKFVKRVSNVLTGGIFIIPLVTGYFLSWWWLLSFFMILNPIRKWIATQSVPYMTQKIVDDEDFYWFLVGADAIRVDDNAEGAK